MKAAEALRLAIPRLSQAGVDGPGRDARILLAHAMQVPADRLTMHLDDPLSDDIQARFEAAVLAREARQPVAQITGRRLFWGRSFRVTPDVLDPRPETETLVAAALEQPFLHVLDLGTGTGCILLTLLMERPDSWGLGVELSPKAFSVAHANRRDYAMEGPMVLRQGSWYEPVTQAFDLIVSNPPYIAAAEMAGLAPEVRDWEPHLALTPGGDGLDAYRAISAGAPEHLTPGGRLMVEIGPTQSRAVAQLFAEAGLQGIALRQDMDGRDRVVIGVKPAT